MTLRPGLPLCLTTLLLLAAAGRAAEPLRLATVDMKRVFEEYWKFADSKELLDAKSKELNRELDDIERRYNELVAQVRKVKIELDSPALSDQARLEKSAFLDKLGQDMGAIDTQVKQRKMELMKFRDAEREKLLRELTVLIRNFALKEKLDVILDSGGGGALGPLIVVHANPALDVTAQVLAAVNAGHEKAAAPSAPNAGGAPPPPAGK